MVNAEMLIKGEVTQSKNSLSALIFTKMHAWVKFFNFLFLYLYDSV